MSPEFEALDRLQGNDLSLPIVMYLPSDAACWVRLLLLLKSDNVEVPHWRCRELFADQSATHELGQMKLRITAEGLLRIK